MSDSRVFFPFCPSRFEMLMAEFLFRVDPARTACVENGDEDEYEFLTDAIADHLVENDGVLTEADWVALSEYVFGTIEYPFGDKNIALFKSFFPDAIVHVKGEDAGALADGQFEWDDRDAYVCDRETFAWWADVVEANQALEDRIHALVQEYGAEKVYEVVHAAGSVDLEGHAANVNQALDEAFGPTA